MPHFTMSGKESSPGEYTYASTGKEDLGRTLQLVRNIAGKQVGAREATDIVRSYDGETITLTLDTRRDQAHQKILEAMDRLAQSIGLTPVQPVSESTHLAIEDGSDEGTHTQIPHSSRG